MVEGLFALLEKIGFSHPLHPMMTHLPMGMVVGMVVFSLIGLLWKSRNWAKRRITAPCWHWYRSFRPSPPGCSTGCIRSPAPGVC